MFRVFTSNLIARTHVGELPGGYTVDHFQALFDGGVDTPENMRLILESLHTTRHRYYRPGGRVPTIKGRR